MYEKLTTEKRPLSRDNAARKLRRQGIVPGVIYGKEMESSLPIKVHRSILHKFLEKAGRVFEVKVGKGKTHLVHLDSLQWDHLGNQLMHIAFHKLQAGEKTTVSLPVHLEGESAGQKEGGILHQTISEIEIEGLPKDIPEYISVDISNMEVNGSIHLSDLTAPQGCTWVAEEDFTIVSCQPPKAEEEPTEEVGPADTPEVDETEEGAGGEASEEGSESSGEEGKES